MLAILVTMRYHDVIRSNIRAELARKDCKVQDAARQISLTPAMFSARLHGRTEWRLGELAALALLLDVPFEHLVAGIDTVLSSDNAGLEVAQ